MAGIRRWQSIEGDLYKKLISPIGIEVWVEHSDVDGLLDCPGGPVIFPFEDLYTLQDDLVVCPPIKVQELRHHRSDVQLGCWCSWACVLW